MELQVAVSNCLKLKPRHTEEFKFQTALIYKPYSPKIRYATNQYVPTVHSSCSTAKGKQGLTVAFVYILVL